MLGWCLVRQIMYWRGQRTPSRLARGSRRSPGCSRHGRSGLAQVPLDTSLTSVLQKAGSVE
jgi:hypothetical protein